jgi:hypothetical protein
MGASERLCRKPEAFGIKPPVEAQLDGEERTLDLVIIEDLRREGLDPLLIPELVVHLARQDAPLQCWVVKPPTEPVRLNNHTSTRLRRGFERRVSALDHNEPVRLHVTPTRHEKGRALLLIRRVYELACQEHHGEGPTKIERLDVGKDSLRSSNVSKHLWGLVHANNRVAELHETMRYAARTAAEFQDLSRRGNCRVHDLGLAFGWCERIKLNRAPVRRVWSRRTHGSPSLEGRFGGKCTRVRFPLRDPARVVS